MSTLPHTCVNTGTTLAGQPSPPCPACLEAARGEPPSLNAPVPFTIINFTPSVVTITYPVHPIAGRDF